MPGLFLITMTVAGCAPDALSNRCLVTSPNDSWSRFNVTQSVTAPSCPLDLPSLGTPKSFVATVDAPEALPRTGAGDLVETRVVDLNSTPSGYTAGLWGLGPRDKLRTHQQGSYLAGAGGAPTNVNVLEDVGRTSFALNQAVSGGEDTASAFVILPYKCCTRPAIIAQNPFSRAGTQTILQVFTAGLAAPSFAWFRDGVRVKPPPGGPMHPSWTQDSSITIGAGIAGTHQWRIDIRHGTWPYPTQTFSLSWTQVVAP